MASNTTHQNLIRISEFASFYDKLNSTQPKAYFFTRSMTDREDNHSNVMVLGNPVTEICPLKYRRSDSPLPPPYIFEVHENPFFMNIQNSSDESDKTKK